MTEKVKQSKQKSEKSQETKVNTQVIDQANEDRPKAKATKQKASVGAVATDEQTATDDRPSQPSAADLLKADVGEIKVRRAKGSKNIHQGICHVLATFNNTKVTFTDNNGNVIASSTSGKNGFKGSRKSTAYAAQIVTQDAAKNAMSHGLKEVAVQVKGAGMGRDSAIRALVALGLIVLSIKDVTPVPHNGCRPEKARRV